VTAGRHTKRPYASYAMPIGRTMQVCRFGMSASGRLPRLRRQPIHVCSCNGFRMPAPITELATRATASGPAFESRQ
jgi:hypothetical protein